MNALTQRHRAQQLLLRRATQSQAARLWPVLDYERLDATFPILAASAARLVQANGQTSAGLSVTYVRELRREQVGGAAKTVIAQALNAEQLATSLRVTSVVLVKKATANGIAPDVAMTNAKTETLGALSRLVLNAGRSTVISSVAADPEGTGWVRVLGGSGCDFCREIADRGDVYSAETADFGAHDHCGCTVEPVYGGESRDVKTYTPSQRFREQAQRDRNNARIRELIKK